MIINDSIRKIIPIETRWKFPFEGIQSSSSSSMKFFFFLFRKKFYWKWSIDMDWNVKERWKSNLSRFHSDDWSDGEKKTSTTCSRQSSPTTFIRYSPRNIQSLNSSIIIGYFSFPFSNRISLISLAIDIKIQRNDEQIFSSNRTFDRF